MEERCGKLRHLKLEQEGKSLIIWLKNPPANTLNSSLMQELKLVLNRALTDSDVLLLILTGEGKFFSAGADIQELKELLEKKDKDQKAFIQNNEAVLATIEDFPKPVIALINGYALGGGCELALACHLRFVSSDAKLGLPEINLGILPGWGGTRRLPKLVGRSRALEMIWTGEIISAEQALKIGLVDRVINPQSLLQEAKDFSRLLTEKSPQAITYILQSITENLTQKRIAEIFANLLRGESARQGIITFLEKRSSKK